MPRKMPFRARDPQATKHAILLAARTEFAAAGLAGARVDRIAERSGANKRMIYHYFGDKDGLFTAVIDATYTHIRSSEQALGLDALAPAEAMDRLVEFTWRYYLDNPEFITLVNSENLHQARHLAGNRKLKSLQKGYVDLVQRILTRGEALGVFRKGIDAMQLCITMAGIGFYYLNNRHTSGRLFGLNFTSRKALATRYAFNLETIRRMVLVNA
jgi:AcrR family transcriptional regulator